MKFASLLYAKTNKSYLTPDGSNYAINQVINIKISANGNNLKFTQYLNKKWIPTRFVVVPKNEK